MPDGDGTKPDVVQLKPLDENALEQLVYVAINDAFPEDVMPPVAGPPGWTPLRQAALRAFHRERRDGLKGGHGEMTFLILHDDQAVGSARLAVVALETLEAGIWLGRTSRGQGIGTDVLRALIVEARATGANRLIAQTNALNAGALHVLSNCGAALAVADSDGHVHAELRLSQKTSG